MLMYLLWLPVLAYPILQVIALCRLKGGARWVGAVPLLGMVPVYMITIVGLVQKSNLWPLIMLFSSPVALLFVGVVLVTARRSGAAAPPGER